MSTSTAMTSLTTAQKMMLAVSLPVGAAAVYILYRRYRESQGEHCVLVGDDQIAVDMKVPQDTVKVIIGRQGTTIKELRKETGARVDVEDGGGSSGEEQVTIVGSPVQACKAKLAIHQLLAESVKITEELHVPHQVVGRIIGRGGECIRAMCRTTGAKIVCEKEPSERIPEVKRMVIISGTRQEVASAKALIEAKMEEEEAFRQNLAFSAASRSHRKHRIGTRVEEASLTSSRVTAPTLPEGTAYGSEGEHRMKPTITVEHQPGGDHIEDSRQSCDSSQVSKFEIPSPDFSFLADEHLDVYVSASENPSHFWIQILGSRCLQLDSLTCEMSRYYRSCSGTGEAFVPKAGDIVAAPFQNDSFWYRACVLGYLENGNADLYYVDYGDNGEAAIGNMQILRSDFLSLPFQAVECSLDGIRPVGEEWSEDAMNCFDSLTYCAEWKVLLARICSYTQNREVTRPQVQLFDRSSGKNLNIGEELVRLGHAEWCHQDDGEGSDAGGKVVPASLQTLLNDITGRVEGPLVSEATTGSLNPQLAISCQNHSEPSVCTSTEAVEDEVF